MAPLGAVVTHKVKIINDYSFDVQAARGEKGGLNKDTHSEEVPKCLCGQAFPTLLQALTDLRERFPQNEFCWERQRNIPAGIHLLLHGG